MLSFIFVIICGLFEWKDICASFVYICVALEIELSRWGLGWDPVIKRGTGLGSSYEEGTGLGSSYEEGGWVGIQLSRGEGWDPINPFNPATCLCLSEAKTWISNVICCGLFLCSVSSVKMRGATCIYIVRFFYIGNG
jgi:hypothetical protein